MDTGHFEPGERTASGGAARVKQNLQLIPDDDATRAAGEYLCDCLVAHPLFCLAVHPKVLSQPLFSRYEPGMSYGRHLDSPILERGRTLRSDVSVTVFLCNADEYDGGALAIDMGSEQVRVKGDAGDCVVYPSSLFHEVEPVSRGVRLVSALWAQSLVRDPSQRAILYDLGCALEFYEVTQTGEPYRERLRNCYNNLFRMWCEL